MKKLIIAIFMLALLNPVEANAFFNRDCKNLETRVVALQKQSDKAWNRYISSIGRIPSSKSAVYSGEEAFIRLMSYVDIGIRISSDMKKYPKCLYGSNSKEISSLYSSLLKVSYMTGFWKHELPFTKRIDYKFFLK